jgi:hypothetical protein
LVVAYEPIWAIGTGKAASAEQAEEIIAKIVRGSLAESLSSAVADQIRILYGGSVRAAMPQSSSACPISMVPWWVVPVLRRMILPRSARLPRIPSRNWGFKNNKKAADPYQPFFYPVPNWRSPASPKPGRM